MDARIRAPCLIAGLVLLAIVVTPVLSDTSFETALLLTQKGDLLMTENRYAEAISAYSESTTLDPYNSIAWNKMGNAYRAAGRNDDALSAFQKAVKLDPYYTKAWDNIGDVQALLGNYSDAVKTYDRAIATNPNDLYALVARGVNLQVLGKETEAKDSFQEAVDIADRELRVHPNDAKFDAALWTNRGNALFRLQRYSEALSSYDRALSVNPKQDEAIRNRNAVLSMIEAESSSINETKVPVVTAPTTPRNSTPGNPAIVILAIGCMVTFYLFRKH